MDRRSLKYTIAAAALAQFPFRDVAHLYTPAPRSAARIPNVVYQTWDHSRLGRTHAAHLERFRRMNPDWGFVLYRMTDCDAFMEDAFRGEPILDVYRRARIGPLRTDIWRYAVLYRNGGLYCDINKMIDVPLSEIVAPSDRAVIAAERIPLLQPVSYDPTPIPAGARALLQHPEFNRLNWCFAFEAGHPFLGRALERIVETYPRVRGRIFADVKAAVVDFTGPRMLTRAVADVLDGRPDTPFTQAGFNFHGHGRHNIRYSWTRYLQAGSYKHLTNRAMID